MGDLWFIIFLDGSKVGYGALIYIPWERDDATFMTFLVMLTGEIYPKDTSKFPG